MNFIAEVHPKKKLLFIFIFLVILLNTKAGYVLELKTKKAIQNGLDYLINHQNTDLESDNFGSFGDYRGERKYRIATTSFACLSLIANGSTPYRGKYGKNLAYGLDFILKCVNKNGYITRKGDICRMHGHGFALLFLAQVYGTMPNTKESKQTRDKIKKAIKLVLESQTKEGGWGYLPNSLNHEGSITVCQLQALRACRNVGFKISKKNIDRALGYLRRSSNHDGSFKYRLGMSRSYPSYPLTAAGVSSLNATGEYDSPEIRKGLKFMVETLSNKTNKNEYYRAFYYYGQFYAAQSLYHAPVEYWNKWYPVICNELLNKQVQKGVWRSKFGSVYATAISTLILQVPFNYLPIFQK